VRSELELVLTSLTEAGGKMVVRKRKKKLEAIEGLKMKVNLCSPLCKGIGVLR